VTVGLPHFLVLAATLFAIGLYGAISKKSAIMVMMSLELMANAVNINLMALSRFVTPEAIDGMFFAMFMMVVAAAEIGLGLALVLAIYRRAGTIETERIDRLRG
jgi:NAD(P)H-quinone oxidoreductase subunit 4L